jgi:zinc protease
MSLHRILRTAFATLLLLVALPAAAWAVNVQSLDFGKNSQVWYVEDHTLPMIAMSVTLPSGSAYDPADRPGLAAFAAALLDEGAGKMNAQAFQSAASGSRFRPAATT